MSEDPDDWLLGSCYLDSCVINLFQSNHRAARADALEALRLSQVTGHAHTRLAALMNLSYLHYQLGDFSGALNIAERLDGFPRGSIFEFGLLDRRISALLELGELDQAEALMSALARWRGETEESGWVLLNASFTYARWLLQKEEWAEASAHLEGATATADQRQDVIWGARLRLLHVEALLALGHAEEALLILLEAEGLAVESGSLPLRAGAERLRGLIHRNSGDFALALRHLNRSLRIAHTLGDAITLRSSAEALETLALKSRLVRTSSESKRELPSLSAPAVLRLTVADRMSPVIATEPERLRTLVEPIENLLSLAESAPLFGRELFELLHDQGVVKSIALLVRTAPNGAEVLECAGWDPSEARLRAGNPGRAAVVDLGQWHGATYQLIAEPKADVSSHITFASIRKIVDAALQLEKYRREEKERSALWPVEDFAGDADGVFVSGEMLDIVTTAKRVAPTTLPVLLTGETGTGKEVLARVIHKASPRADKVFSAFNCTAVPRDMLDSQLFGYRRGAFTGAQDGFAGVIRGAHGGTLFLDEIGEIGLDLQPKLLRFLETGEIHPLGEVHPVKVDVRIIAATNANLDRLVGEGRFREDLLYRLNVIRFRIPPLRERREEIPLLVEHFIRRAADEFKKGRPRATDETMEYLLLFGWPGNVRQLANELRRIVALLEPDGEITPAHLSTDIRAARRTVPVESRRAHDEVVVRIDQPLATVLESIERLMVSRALEQSGGKVEDAAQRLGISRKGLFLKRKRWGMPTRPAD